MSLINCKEPNCNCQVDTTLACKEVSSLFGLRIILEYHLENKDITNIFNTTELETQLDFVKQSLSKYKIHERENKFELFKNKKKNNTVSSRLSQLYLECNKGHRYYYDVECEP